MYEYIFIHIHLYIFTPPCVCVWCVCVCACVCVCIQGKPESAFFSNMKKANIFTLQVWCPPAWPRGTEESASMMSSLASTTTQLTREVAWRACEISYWAQLAPICHCPSGALAASTAQAIVMIIGILMSNWSDLKRTRKAGCLLRHPISLSPSAPSRLPKSTRMKSPT